MLDCLYDGGDCCQENPLDSWDSRCNLCECVEHEETPVLCPDGDGTCNDPVGQCSIIGVCLCSNGYVGPSCSGMFVCSLRKVLQ